MVNNVWCKHGYNVDRKTKFRPKDGKAGKAREGEIDKLSQSMGETEKSSDLVTPRLTW